MKLTPLIVLDRSSFALYYAGYIVLAALVVISSVIGIKITLLLLLGEMVITTAAFWILAYSYNKRRWVPPKEW